jgi:hypothetical protein
LQKLHCCRCRPHIQYGGIIASGAATVVNNDPRSHIYH